MTVDNLVFECGKRKRLNRVIWRNSQRLQTTDLHNEYTREDLSFFMFFSSAKEAVASERLIDLLPNRPIGCL